MAFSIRSRWQAASRRQRVIVIAVALYLLYVMLGFFVVSPVARQQVINALTDATGREVQLEKLLFNPLTLSVTADGFALLDEDGSEFVAFDRFHANFQLTSLFRRSWHFSEIRLEQPRTHVTQLAEGRFNFDDLLAPSDELDATPAPPSEPLPDGEAVPLLPAISFSRFTLNNGAFRYVDKSRDTVQEMSLAPVSFTVLDFSTRGTGEEDNQYTLQVTGPGGGSFTWVGGFSVDPLIATGKLAITGVDLPPFADFISHQLHFTVPSGQLDFQTAYRIETGDGLRAWLTDGAVTLRDLVIHDPAQQRNVVELPSVALRNVRLDTPERNLTLGELTLTDPGVRARLLEDGIDLVALFEPVTLEETGEPAPDTDAESLPGEPWALILETLQLDNATLAFRDETLPEAGELAVTPITLTLRDLALNDPRRFNLEGALTLAGSGEVALTGEGQVAPLDVTLGIDARALPLPAFQPWVRSALLVSVPEGTASADIDIHASGDDDTRVTVSGGAGVQGLRVNEANNRRLLTLGELTLEGLNIDTRTQRVHLQRASVTGLDAVARVDADGRGIAERILPPDDGSTSSGDPWAIQLDELRLNDSRTRYMDQSMTPNFSVALTRINGQLRELDAAGSRPATIDLSARVDDHAPLTVKGSLNPLAATPTVDLDVTLNGYEMTSLTPFTGRFLGYATRTGQLGVNSSLKLEGSLLESRTRVKAASFFLGDRIESAEAMNIPIKLGLAVIRDRNELIDLPVQARGDLSDPSVSVHGIILRALTNILVRAATSPFSVLASLVGGEDLQHVTFPAGSADIEDSTREQLSALAQVLVDRPTLNVTLAGSANDADREAVSAIVLGYRLTGGDWSTLEAAASERRFQRQVSSQYREATGQAPEDLVPPLPEGADREQRNLFDQQVASAAFLALARQQADTVNPELLRGLATRRANDAKTLLMDEFDLPGERLRITSPNVGSSDAVQGISLGLAPD